MIDFLNSIDPETLQMALIGAVVALATVLIWIFANLRRQYPPQPRLPHVRPFTDYLMPKPVTGTQAFEHVNALNKDSHPFDPAHCPDCARLELRLGRQTTYPGPIRK